MTPSKNCIDLIKKFEGLRLEAYQCSAKVWTIGYGSTMYPDGTKVKQGDTCTLEQAQEYLMQDLAKRSGNIATILPDDIKQNKFDALLSFAYNLGIGALKSSTLLKKVKLNQFDPSIPDEFMKWVKAGGKVLKGLELRRKAEAELYSK